MKTIWAAMRTRDQRFGLICGEDVQDGVYLFDSEKKAKKWVEKQVAIFRRWELTENHFQIVEMQVL